jgi:hypothetical protein
VEGHFEEKPAMRYLALVAVSALALAAPTRADEENIPLDKVPKPVLEAVKKRFPKAQIISASKETEDDITLYEIELKQGSKEIDVTVTPEGVITLIEQEIDSKELPRAVANTVAKNYPKTRYRFILAVYTVKDGKETLAYYDIVLATTSKKEIDIQIFPDGKIKEDD